MVVISYSVQYNTLLQNATDIIAKWDSYFITNCDKSLIQNLSEFFVQNAIVLLQFATVITKCVGTTQYIMYCILKLT